MESSLWEKLNGEEHIQSIFALAYRMIESQEEVATALVTDTLDEQSLLEELLENTKPVQSQDLASRHYLIKTPFRYPPLRYGSRFGRRFEPSLFYGSDSIETVLHEVAYYRFRFLNDIATPESITKYNPQSNHSTFCVNLQSEQGIDLCAEPFNQFSEAISHPSQYQLSQSLGTEMRKANVELFRFQSARFSSGTNFACFSHLTIKSQEPKNMSHWQCLTQTNRVVFTESISRQSYEFSRETFLFENEFPIVSS